MTDKNLKVLALNDICTYGKVSLTVNIPILSAFNIEVAPLPTVLLSNHTQFESFCAFDLTEQITAIVEELKLRKPIFDAFYIGWIGGEAQTDLAISIVKDFNMKFVMIDPILGDNGKLYVPITDEHVKNMRRLIAYANVITPNVTEAAALLGHKLDSNPDLATIKEWAKALVALGPKSVIITSVERGTEVGSLCYSNGVVSEYYHEKVPIHTPGTGDSFGSAALGYFLTGCSLELATEKATRFVYSAVLAAHTEQDDHIHGIAIERRLNLL